MGLSGRKVKQRIGNDPRNLSWSDDAARFGSSYLSKFGWDPSKGLGVEGDGRTSHLKVSQKLDLYGIGAAHQKDPNGIAWKQNKDFERLLERLNTGGSGEEKDGPKISGFASATVSKAEALGPAITTGNEGTPEEGDVSTEAKLKRKKDRDTEDKVESKKRRKKSKEMEISIEKPTSSSSDSLLAASEKKAKKRKTRKATDTVPEGEIKAEIEAVFAQTTVSKPATGPVRGHRTRFIRSKRMALTDSAAMAEVLGIAPTPTSSSSITTSIVASSTPSSTGDVTPEPALQLEVLTTSTKSVMDYFKEKLAAKAASSSSSPFSAPSPPEMDGSVSRMGLGAFSRLRDVPTEEEKEDLPRRMGLGTFRAEETDFTASNMTLPMVASNSLGKNTTPDAVDEEEESARRREKKERKAARREFDPAL